MHILFPYRHCSVREPRLLSYGLGEGVPAVPAVPPGNSGRLRWNETARRSPQHAANAVRYQAQQRMNTLPNGYMYGLHHQPVGPYAMQMAQAYRPYGSMHPPAYPQSGFGRMPNYGQMPYTHGQPFLQQQMLPQYTFAHTPFPANTPHPSFSELFPGQDPHVPHSANRFVSPGLGPVEQGSTTEFEPYASPSPYGAISPYFFDYGFRWTERERPDPRAMARRARVRRSTTTTRIPEVIKEAPKEQRKPERIHEKPQERNPMPPVPEQVKKEALSHAQIQALESLEEVLTTESSTMQQKEAAFEKITKWDVEWAKKIVELRPGYISLHVQNMPAAVASEFAKYRGNLYMYGSVTPEILNTLNKFTGFLHLEDVANLTPALATALGESKPTRLIMPKVQTFSVQAAKELAKCSGTLDLSSAVNVTEDAAVELGAHNGGLWLGISKVSEKLAESLGKISHPLWLKEVADLTDKTAELLSENTTQLYLPKITSITPGQAAHLGRCPSLDLGLTQIDEDTMKALVSAIRRPSGAAELRMVNVQTIDLQIAKAMGAYTGSIEIGLQTITQEYLEAILVPKNVKNLTMLRMDFAKINQNNFAVKKLLKNAIREGRVTVPTMIKEWAQKED